MPLKSLNYSQKLTKRVPRNLDRMKEPNLDKIAILDKEGQYRRKFREMLKLDLRVLRSLNGEVNSVYAMVQFNFMVSKLSKHTDGRDLHIYLPFTGMEPVGYFYKGYLEQHYPKARVTFLVTPQMNTMVRSFSKESEEHLRNHLKRSLNVNDKLFFVFDSISAGTTLKRITETLGKIVSNPKVMAIGMRELGHGVLFSPKNFKKEESGKEVRPFSSLDLSDRGNEFGEKFGKNKFTPRELEKIRKITQQFFYYHGSKLQIDYKDRNIVGFLKKLKSEKTVEEIEPYAHEDFRKTTIQ
ncbi:MAG: hypothetical protein WCX82_03955 [archaeon]